MSTTSFESPEVISRISSPWFDRNFSDKLELRLTIVKSTTGRKVSEMQIPLIIWSCLNFLSKFSSCKRILIQFNSKTNM